MRFLLLSVFLFFFSFTLYSQSYVIPKGFNAKEGNSYVWVPTKYSPSRAQYIYSKDALPFTSARIKGLRLRRDGINKEIIITHKYEIEVFMSNNERDPAQGYTRLWSTNRGKDFTCVMKKKSIEMKASLPPNTPPAPFSVSFVFDKPFPYKGKALLVEFVVHGRGVSSIAWYADAQTYTGWTGYPKGGYRRYFGQGCPWNFYNYGEYPYIGYKWYHYGLSRVYKKKLLAFDIIGSNRRKFGSINLPLDLTKFGAKGCFLYTDIISIFQSYTDPGSPEGRVDFDLGVIPNLSILVGLSYFEQQIVLDDKFNSLGVRMSRLSECRIGGPFTGKVDCLQIFDFGTGFTLENKWARFFYPKAIILEADTN